MATQSTVQRVEDCKVNIFTSLLLSYNIFAIPRYLVCSDKMEALLEIYPNLEADFLEKYQVTILDLS